MDCNRRFHWSLDKIGVTTTAVAATIQADTSKADLGLQVNTACSEDYCHRRKEARDHAWLTHQKEGAMLVQTRMLCKFKLNGIDK